VFLDDLDIGLTDEKNHFIYNTLVVKLSAGYFADCMEIRRSFWHNYS